MNRPPLNPQQWAEQRRAASERAQALRAEREALERLAQDVLPQPSESERHLPCCTCSLCRTQQTDHAALLSSGKNLSPSPWEKDTGGWSSDFTELCKNGFDALATEKRRSERGVVCKRSQGGQQFRSRSLSQERDRKFVADRPMPASASGMRARVKPSARADDGPSTRINFDKRTSRHMHAGEFQPAIAEFRSHIAMPPRIPQNDNVQFFVRKRPLFGHERRRGEYDVITVVPGWAFVHVCGMAADLQRMHIMHNQFPCSESFGEGASNVEVYTFAMRPLVMHAIQGGMSTCLMYGATGSGKTYTMSTMQEHAVVDLFAAGAISVLMLELAGKDVRDLLSLTGPQNITLRDTASGDLDMVGVSMHQVLSPDDLVQCLALGQQRRTTCSTFANGVSSRSHMVVFLQLSNGGTLVLLDCAGSERKEDSFTHTAERQREGADINTSLHALKECIRALTSGASHVPYRMNSLTRVLRASFVTPGAKFHVVATVAPGCSDAEHSVATLRMGCGLCESGSKIIECKQEIGTVARKPASVVDRESHSGHRARSVSPVPRHENDHSYGYEASLAKLHERPNFYGNHATHIQCGNDEHTSLTTCHASPTLVKTPLRRASDQSTSSQASSNPERRRNTDSGTAIAANQAPRPRLSSGVPKPVPLRQATSTFSKGAKPRSVSPMNRGSMSSGLSHPGKWSSDDLQSWLNRQKIAAKLPVGTDGRTAIRWNTKKWTEACGGDERAGLKAFNGMRLEIDRIADEEKQWRKRVMKGR